ncbi:alpha/beta hydrolase [Pseudomonas sp. KSR10]|nr:alpha/beta hydrolase [Pseudomonas sp. KSR10]MCG6539802.1 alpha/beta hydrolase [Pseudomonas sp. KSR10]
MLHQELSAFLDMVDERRQSGRPALHELSVERAREEFEAASQALKAGAPRIPVEQLELELPGRTLPARLYRPTPQSSAPVVLYFHGGGYVVGSLESHDGLCRTLAEACGCTVLAVGYRLAPEHPLPAAPDDARAAWEWLRVRAAGLGIDPTRVAVAGDSAGATLASVLAAQLAAEGGPLPCAQLLFYPAVDAQDGSESRELFADGYLLESATLEWFYRQYAPEQSQRCDWHCSPLYAGERLRGSAAALLLIAEFDPLVDEGLAYAKALQEQGVDVEVTLCRGLTHDFLRMSSLLPDVAAYFHQIARFLRERW